MVQLHFDPRDDEYGVTFNNEHHCDLSAISHDNELVQVAGELAYQLNNERISPERAAQLVGSEIFILL